MTSEKSPVLPVAESAAPTAPRGGRRSKAKWGLLVITSALALLTLFQSNYLSKLDLSAPPCLRSLTTSSALGEAQTTKYKSAVPKLGVPEKIQRQWGQYSPYYPAGKYVAPPKGCVIDQVNIVRRSRIPRAVHALTACSPDSSKDTVLGSLIMTTTTKLLWRDFKLRKRCMAISSFSKTTSTRWGRTT
jgi:hypothetical protein